MPCMHACMLAAQRAARGSNPGRAAATLVHLQHVQAAVADNAKVLGRRHCQPALHKGAELDGVAIERRLEARHRERRGRCGGLLLLPGVVWPSGQAAAAGRVVHSRIQWRVGRLGCAARAAAASPARLRVPAVLEEASGSSTAIVLEK